MDSDDDEFVGKEGMPSSTGDASLAKEFSLDNLPPEFVSFLAKNEIDPAIYTVKDLPRYIRLNPDPQRTTTAEELERELGTKVEPVAGLEAFCKLSGQVKLRNSQAYKDGKIFGMDLSSGLAVYALDVQPGDHVLDICCAPGAKLCMIAGLLTNSDQGQTEHSMSVTGTVTGVDISQHRLSTCRSLLKRHRLQQYARLFRADGTTFGVMRPSAIDTILARKMAGKKKDDGKEEKRPLPEDPQDESHTDEGSSAKRQKVTTNAAVHTGQTEGTSNSQQRLEPFYAPKMLRNDPQLEGECYKYDKVIVDAECTHDGSIAHILKYETWGWDSFHKNFMSQDRLDSLCDLQRGLLMNGFRMTRKGGIVVYSTCSLSRAQNEDVVAWFLATMKGQAILEALPKHALGIATANCKLPCEQVIASALGVQDAAATRASDDGEVERLRNHVKSLCLRYDPIASNTSGFFLARIRKL